eukprot:UN09634
MKEAINKSTNQHLSPPIEINLAMDDMIDWYTSHFIHTVLK